jgi:hypothetical protein
MILQLLWLSGSFLLSPEISSGPAVDHECGTGTGWQMERNTSGVKTYVRWIEAEGSLKVRERKSVMEVNCSVDDVVRLLSDVGNTGIWMGGIRECYCLEKISPSEWYAYTLFDIPWPFEKRDLVSNFRVESPVKGKQVMIYIRSRDQYIPSKPHVTRLADYRATWTIAGIGEKRTFVSFSAISNDPPLFPRYIQDPILLRMFHNNIVNLKKILET